MEFHGEVEEVGFSVAYFGDLVVEVADEDLSEAVQDRVREVVGDGLGEGVGTFRVATHLRLLGFGSWHRIFLIML